MEQRTTEELVQEAISSFCDYKQSNGGYTGFTWLEVQVIFREAYRMGAAGETWLPDWHTLMADAISKEG